MNNLIGKFVKEEQFMTKYIILSNSNEVIRVSPDRIAYIISDGNYSSMVLTDREKHTFSFNLSAFERILEQRLDGQTQTFIRLGKQLIINSSYIYHINISKQQITLSDIKFPAKFTLKASKDALRTLKSALEKSIKTTSFD